MQRLKLPAFGRALLNARDCGRHPSSVVVWYGDRWFDRPKDIPCLCVGDDYTHGVFDWAVVAGVPVRILWISGRRIRRLVAEVCEYSPRVIVKSGNLEWEAETFFAMHLQRRRHPLWPADVEEDYLARNARYYEAMLESVENGRIRDIPVLRDCFASADRPKRLPYIDGWEKRLGQHDELCRENEDRERTQREAAHKAMGFDPSQGSRVRGRGR